MTVKRVGKKSSRLLLNAWQIGLYIIMLMEFVQTLHPVVHTEGYLCYVRKKVIMQLRVTHSFLYFSNFGNQMSSKTIITYWL